MAFLSEILNLVKAKLLQGGYLIGSREYDDAKVR